MDQIVDTAWLAAEIGKADLRILDATWYLPGENRDPNAEFLDAHIPGALFFDHEAIRDGASRYPNTLPSAELFTEKARELGIDPGTRIVIYDNSPWKTSARAWWMFRHFGVEHVAVLDGGFDAWKASGGEVEQGHPGPVRPGSFVARPGREFSDIDDVRATLRSGTAQLVDARSAERFQGKLEEPRPGVRAGHIPGSANIPSTSLFDANGRLKDKGQLRELFDEAGVDLGRPIITTCGSGVTAANLLLAAQQLGAGNISLYDGSWAEWGSQPENPVATGAG